MGQEEIFIKEIKKYKTLTIIFAIISVILAILLINHTSNISQIVVEKEASID